MKQQEPEDPIDLRARAELALAFEPGQPPEALFRTTPLLRRPAVRRGIVAFALLAGAFAAVLALRPPELVRAAIEHEYYERTLRGSFMEPAAMLPRLGLGGATAVPGFPQLMRPCEIEDRLVYHLTTFFERGGMVTVFAFDAPVPLAEDAGWWDNMYWQVIDSRDGRPLIMVAQKKQALAVARAFLGRPPS